MSTEQKPETWGYGLTWIVTIGLTALIIFGSFKLYASAKSNTERLEKEREIAQEAASGNIDKNNKEVDELEKQREEEKAAQLAGGASPTDSGDKLKGDPKAGKALYGTCIACHQADGAGNPALFAPPIAGQSEWYIEKSLNKFINGFRGGDMAKEPQAGTMATMVKSVLTDDKKVKDVAAYVATLEPVKPTHKLKGDAEKGKALYNTCVACHGDKAQGNPATKGPALVNLPDWYMLKQIKKFKDGLRGANPAKEPHASQMAAISKTVLTTDQKIKDVLEYIKTFNK